MADEFKIKVIATGDASGAKEVTSALKETTSAIDKHGEASKEAAGLVEQFGRKGQAAHDVVEGLTRAAEGGIGGLLGLAKAAYNAKEALAVSGFGLILGVFLGLGPALIEAAKNMAGFAEAEKRAAEEAERAKGKIADMLAESAKLSGQTFELFKSNIDDITRKFKEARDAIDQVQAAADKLDDAELAAQLAENKVKPGLSDQERNQNELSIRRGFQFQKRDRAEGVRREKERLAAQELAATEFNEASAGRAYGELQRGVDERKRAREDAERVLEELKRQQEKTAAFVVPSEGGEPTANPEFFTRRQQIEELQSKVDESYSPGAKEGTTRLLADLEARKKAFEAATKAANDAYDAQQKLLNANTRDRDLEQKLAGPEYRQYYAEKFGAVVDSRTQSDPVYKPETRVRDAAALRSGYGADGLNRIGDKIISSSEKLSGSIEIGGVARAVEKLAGAIESKIEIDGRKYDAITKRLDQVESVVRTSNRGN